MVVKSNFDFLKVEVSEINVWVLNIYIKKYLNER